MHNVYREAFVFECALADRKFYLPKDGEMKLQFFHFHDCELLNRIQKSVSEKFLSEINRNNTKNNVKYGFFYVIRWNKLTLL